MGAPAQDHPRTVDAHVHLWDLARRPQPWIDPRAMAILDRSFRAVDLHPELADAHIAGAVLVQVLNDAAESDDLIWSASREPFLGAIPWVDLVAPGLARRLEDLVAHPSGTHVAGVRQQLLAESDPAGWLEYADACGAFEALGSRTLSFDLLVRPDHLPSAYRVVRRNSDTTFVLDHACKPPLASGWSSVQSQQWARSVTLLSELPNAHCKLSGLTVPANGARTPVQAELQPYVDHLIATFGPERLMFGSDWPVSLRGGSYAHTVDLTRSLLARLSPSERHHVLTKTAARVYRLAFAAV